MEELDLGPPADFGQIHAGLDVQSGGSNPTDRIGSMIGEPSLELSELAHLLCVSEKISSYLDGWTPYRTRRAGAHTLE